MKKAVVTIYIFLFLVMAVAAPTFSATSSISGGVMQLAKAVQINDTSKRLKAIGEAIDILSVGRTNVPAEESARIYFLARAYFESKDDQKAKETLYVDFPSAYFLAEGEFLQLRLHLQSLNSWEDNMGGFYHYSEEGELWSLDAGLHLWTGKNKDPLFNLPPANVDHRMLPIDNVDWKRTERAMDLLLEMGLTDLAGNAAKILESFKFDGQNMGFSQEMIPIYIKLADADEQRGDWNDAIAYYYKILFMTQDVNVLTKLRDVTANAMANKEAKPLFPTPDLKKLTEVVLCYEDQDMYEESLQIIDYAEAIFRNTSAHASLTNLKIEELEKQADSVLKLWRGFGEGKCVWWGQVIDRQWIAGKYLDALRSAPMGKEGDEVRQRLKQKLDKLYAKCKITGEK